VLFVLLRLVDSVWSIQAMAPAVYWGVVGGSAVVVLLVASVTYRFLEHPFLAAGKNRAKLQPTKPPVESSVAG
jgi:peptidoglycan/LPS O-acetylase OafA/YrhL